MEIDKPKYFNENGYVALQSIIPKDICKVVTQYCLLQEKTMPQKEEEAGQVPFSHSVYADTLMETLMVFMRPHMEKFTGLELCPTYSYFRVYRPGMELERHTDRQSCEISTTICFGMNYIDTAKEYNWGMYVDPSHRHNINDEHFISTGNKGIMTAQNPGDCIVYRGCEIEHWRDPFEAGENSWQVQGFFHYINKNGPYYPEFAYDKRAGVGFKNRA
jgi:hypothetical protein